MKLKHKIKRLTSEDRKEYYIRFEEKSFLNHSFSYSFYTLMGITMILFTTAAIYIKLDGEGTLQLISSITTFNRIIVIMFTLDCMFFIWKFISYYYKRNKWFKSKGL